MNIQFTSYKVEKRGIQQVFSDGQWGTVETNLELATRITDRDEADRLAKNLGGFVVTLNWGFTPSWAV